MGNRLYVGNLPFSADEDQVRELFSQDGCGVLRTIRHGGRSGHDIPARKHSGNRGLEGLIGVDVSPLVQPDVRRLSDDRVGIRSDGIDDHVDLDLELSSFDRFGTAAAGAVGFTQFILDATKGADVPLIVTEELERRGQPLKVDALFNGVMNLLIMILISKITCAIRLTVIIRLLVSVGFRPTLIAVGEQIGLTSNY